MGEISLLGEMNRTSRTRIQALASGFRPEEPLLSPGENHRKSQKSTEKRRKTQKNTEKHGTARNSTYTNISIDQDIMTSRHQSINASRHQDIKTSRHHRIKTSKHPHIKTLLHQYITTSTHQDNNASSHQCTTTSRHQDINTSRHHDIVASGYEYITVALAWGKKSALRAPGGELRKTLMLKKEGARAAGPAVHLDIMTPRHRDNKTSQTHWPP